MSASCSDTTSRSATPVAGLDDSRYSSSSWSDHYIIPVSPSAICFNLPASKSNSFCSLLCFILNLLSSYSLSQPSLPEIRVNPPIRSPSIYNYKSVSSYSSDSLLSHLKSAVRACSIYIFKNSIDYLPLPPFNSAFSGTFVYLYRSQERQCSFSRRLTKAFKSS